MPKLLTKPELDAIRAREKGHQYWLSIGGSMDFDAPKDRAALLDHLDAIDALSALEARFSLQPQT